MHGIPLKFTMNWIIHVVRAQIFGKTNISIALFVSLTYHWVINICKNILNMLVKTFQVLRKTSL